MRRRQTPQKLVSFAFCLIKFVQQDLARASRAEKAACGRGTLLTSVAEYAKCAQDDTAKGNYIIEACAAVVRKLKKKASPQMRGLRENLLSI